jgi:hypothetical protein
MKLWNRLVARFGPQPDLLGFTPTATPDADTWLTAFTGNFMSHPTAAHGADALMSGLRFYTLAFVAELQALPSIDVRQPRLAGRIPRAIYATTGPIIVDVYQNLISRNTGHGAIQAAFLQAMPGLVNQYNYIMR